MIITHKFICKRTADDIRAVIKIMEERLKEVECGDADAGWKLFSEEMTRWPEALMLRFSYLDENKGTDVPDMEEKP
jgi:hypothetical protein